MKENVGRTDRIARSIIGPGLMMVGISWLSGSSRNWPGIAALVGGTLILESAVTRVCPVNALLGLDTRRKSDDGYDLNLIADDPPQPLLPQA